MSKCALLLALGLASSPAFATVATQRAKPARQQQQAPAGPPAWRAFQLAELPTGYAGPLDSSPPCMRAFEKRGSGHSAAWRLATYDGESPLEVRIALDANPAEPCCKLFFIDPTAHPSCAKVGHMLLACGVQSSALRGMYIRESLRGRGLSRLLLAIWLRLCVDARVEPSTRVINKPLLSLTLQRFGFSPRLTGLSVELEGAASEPGGRTAYVRTEFAAPTDGTVLAAAIEAALAGGSVRADGLGACSAAVKDVRRALTLR